MDKKQLLSKETFINLFSMDKIDQIEEENRLYLLAEQLGEKRKFEETLKRYRPIFNDSLVIGSDKELPKSNYDIDNINFGEYRCEIDGIKDKNNVKFSYFPVIPVERYINQETGREKIKIIFYKEEKWQEMIVERSQLAISQKLLLLSDYGLDVNSENVRCYINYFSYIMNENTIKTYDSISHIGWKGDKFLPYDSHGIFDGAEEFKSIYQAISSKGSYEKWKATIKELRKNKVIKLLMAVTLASPLLEKLNLQPYMVNLWSSLSGNGKTLSCMVAMSIWGNPDIGALRLSSNSTQNFYSVTASFMRNFTCYFDELQIVKKNMDLESLVMDLCNGTERGRLNKNSQMCKVKTWYNNFLFTSNDKLVKENAGEQVYNRVIDLEVRENLTENGKGQETARVVKNNYGFAGKDYIKYIETVDSDEFFKRFQEIDQEILAKTKATSKQSSSLASILLANELANKCIFDDDYILGVEDIKEYVNDKDEIKTSVKAKEYIIGIINANYKKFEDNNYECWGSKNNYVCMFNTQMLYRELKKGGYEFDTVKKEWAEMGFLEKSSTGRFIHQTTVRNEKGSYIKLNL